MGYSTNFDGKLTFKTEPTLAQLSALQDILGEDCRDHKDWNAPQYCYYIDLKVLKDFSGVTWNDAEKTSNMADIINVVLTQMRKTWPEFGFEGGLLAQGEDIDDRYMVVIGEDGIARKEPVVIVGAKIECPKCGHKFRTTTLQPERERYARVSA